MFWFYVLNAQLNFNSTKLSQYERKSFNYGNAIATTCRA